MGLICIKNYFPCVPAFSKCKKIFNHPKVQRFQLLFSAFLFSVVLITADIVTDISTSIEFFWRGHYYWGVFTLVPVFLPLFAKVILNLVFLSRCFKIEYSNSKCLGMSTLKKVSALSARLSFCLQELTQLIWHIPLFQPIRY
jgi:hypothetical protein